MARYDEIRTYLQQNNFDSAYAVMDRLPIEFKLKEKEITEKDRTKQLIGIVQNYRNAGRGDATLDSSDIAALQNVVGNYYDQPAEMARNLLCFGYGICRSPLSGGDNGGAQARLVPVHETPPTEEPPFTVFPNPSQTWAAINYNLGQPAANAEVVVRDITGRTVISLKLQDQQGQKVLDTRQLAPGTYTVDLTNGDQHLQNTKLVVRP